MRSYLIVLTVALFSLAHSSPVYGLILIILVKNFDLLFKKNSLFD